MWTGDRGRTGHTLIETLVVVAIIAILFAVQMPTLSRAIRYARQVEVKEGMRQQHIGKLADAANIARPTLAKPATREAARAAFRQKIQTSKGDAIGTELLYKATNEAEFRAYYAALVDPADDDEPVYEAGLLVAQDPVTGTMFRLAPIGDPMTRTGAPFPVGWEFLSTRASDMSANSLGINVMYSDGHVELVKYPGPYPAVRTVAELSQAFVDGQ